MLWQFHMGTLYGDYSRERALSNIRRAFMSWPVHRRAGGMAGTQPESARLLLSVNMAIGRS